MRYNYPSNFLDVLSAVPAICFVLVFWLVKYILIVLYEGSKSSRIYLPHVLKY